MTDSHKELRILVCDDDADTCELIEFIGQRKGYSVSSCRSRDALDEALSNYKPNAVFMDLHWGETSGLDAVDQLRQHHVDKVIAVSGMPDLDIIAGEAHLDGFMEKPFGLKQIEHLMDQLASEVCYRTT